MSIRDLLEGAAFDPETIQALCAAYDKAKKELHDTGQPDVVREVIASKIIKLAETGERDPDRLCSGALSAIRIPR